MSHEMIVETRIVAEVIREPGDIEAVVERIDVSEVIVESIGPPGGKGPPGPPGKDGEAVVPEEVIFDGGHF